MLDDDDMRHLRRCVALATEALDAGDEPFGSVLVGADGTVLFEDRNRVAGGDATRHPEFEIARWAAANLTPQERKRATVYTSGEHKAFLDPFQPPKEEETQFWKSVLETTHRQFIDSVKQGRGERLKAEENPELFSGLVWSGEQALQLGLIDALGSASYVAREVVGAKEIVDFTVRDTPFDRFAKRLGTSVADRIALWMGFQGPTLR